MNLLYLFLLIPLSFADSPPGCEGLAQILQEYERDIHDKPMASCTTLTHQQIVGNLPVLNPNFLEGKLCQDIYTIEAQLEKLKLEEAILTGINKLKTSVATNQAGTSNPNPTVSRVAGMRFVDSLDTAQSLEVLLQTSSTDGKYVIEKLKALEPNQLLNQNDLALRVSEICKDENKSQQNACNPNIFKPGPEAARELIKLISETPSITTSQVSSWQRMLKIKRKDAKEGDEEYSFNQMKQEMTAAFEAIDNNQVMSKDHIRAISKLDQFENATGLSFVEDITLLKDQKKAKIASDKFQLLMGDAKTRQQYEVMSKISVVWDNFKEINKNSPVSLTDSQKADCENSKNLYNLAKSCESHLREANRDIGNNNLNDFLDAIKSSIDYADKLETAEASCKTELERSGTLSESCFNQINNDLAQVQDKITQLNLIKRRIGSENVEKMQFRNFALNKWVDQNCSVVSSPIDFCEDNTSISKNALLTLSDSLKVAVLFTPKPEVNAEVEKVCEEKEEELKDKDTPEASLCKFFNDTTSDVIQTDNADDSVQTVGVEAPDGGHDAANTRDAWIAGGAKVLGTLLPSLLPKVTPPPRVNPYPMNYNPYAGGLGAMGIADSIMFNARTQGGYGFYMPTPGLQPGTAFGMNSSFGGYKAASVGSSKYFSF